MVPPHIKRYSATRPADFPSRTSFTSTERLLLYFLPLPQPMR